MASHALKLAAVALALSVTPAVAYDRWNSSGFSLDHHFHSRYDGMFRVYPNYYPTAPAAQQPTARIITRIPADDDEAEYQKWLAFCKPEEHVNNEGITFLTYAEKGCDMGRSE
jgi:hypothetical protein